MNNEKDTKKTELYSYGQNSFVGSKSLLNQHIYEFANKKTEKLITALYMVTDCMETEDALKEKLRLLGVHLLSDMFKLPTLLPVDKHTQINLSLTSIYEILSFIEISYTLGYISEMNTDILKREFNILSEDLKSHQSKDKHFSFILDEQMFNIPTINKEKENLSLSVFNRGNDIKRTHSMSFINKRTESNVLKKSLPYVDHKKIKSERVDKIISIIKDKKEASIKDIALLFTDCSEKTIQRELNDLIDKGQIRKIGAKRWSRYSLITN